MKSSITKKKISADTRRNRAASPTEKNHRRLQCSVKGVFGWIFLALLSFLLSGQIISQITQAQNQAPPDESGFSLDFPTAAITDVFYNVKIHNKESALTECEIFVRDELGEDVSYLLRENRIRFDVPGFYSVEAKLLSGNLFCYDKIHVRVAKNTFGDIEAPMISLNKTTRLTYVGLGVRLYLDATDNQTPSEYLQCKWETDNGRITLDRNGLPYLICAKSGAASVHVSVSDTAGNVAKSMIRVSVKDYKLENSDQIYGLSTVPFSQNGSIWLSENSVTYSDYFFNLDPDQAHIQYYACKILSNSGGALVDCSVEVLSKNTVSAAVFKLFCKNGDFLKIKVSMLSGNIDVNGTVVRLDQEIKNTLRIYFKLDETGLSLWANEVRIIHDSFSQYTNKNVYGYGFAPDHASLRFTLNH